jgi:tRNA uridine 5-carboxymethylaminomethyl modification enzyme
MDKVRAKSESFILAKEALGKISLDPDEINLLLETMNSAVIVTKQKAVQILLRPNIALSDMLSSVPALQNALKEFDRETLEQVEILTKYETYIDKERELVSKMSQLEDLLIPEKFNYDKLVSLSNEARQKFSKIRPRTLGQASRISGVNPSDVQILMVFMGR